MISMRRAFNKHTTTRCYHQFEEQGHWDEHNEWIEGTTTPLTPFNATILPVKGMDDLASGNSLHALPEGERVSKVFCITTTLQLPINSYVYYEDYKLKVIAEGDYKAAGFYSVIAEDVRDKEL